MALSSPLAVAVLAVCLLVVEASRSSDRITSLPDYSGNLGNQWAGYIPVDSVNGRSLFYWFAEAVNPQPDTPVVLWLQGGPGCSSLIGLLTENGPVQPAPAGDPTNKLVDNPYAWRRLAHTLYLENPAGVGFSYSKTPSDYSTNNNRTAHDGLIALQYFFKNLFPEHSSAAFYITGESYGGDYVPDLVYAILNSNDTALSSQLKGFAIGNPVFDCDNGHTGGPSARDNLNLQIDLFYYHGLVSLRDYNAYKALQCSDSAPSQACISQYNTLLAKVGPLDADNLYTDFCTGNATLDLNQEVPQCNTVQKRRDAYINRADVRKAIHATVPTAAPNNTWQECAGSWLNYSTAWSTTLPYYRYFFENAPHLRILIYSGDVDIATVPHAFTQKCLLELNEPLTSDWRRWTSAGSGITNSGTTLGYTESTARYTFATVKGAGHEVPMYQPYSAYLMISRFLAGKEL